MRIYALTDESRSVTAMIKDTHGRLLGKWEPIGKDAAGSRQHLEMPDTVILEWQAAGGQKYERQIGMGYQFHRIDTTQQEYVVTIYFRDSPILEYYGDIGYPSTDKVADAPPPETKAQQSPKPEIEPIALPGIGLFLGAPHIAAIQAGVRAGLSFDNGGSSKIRMLHALVEIDPRATSYRLGFTSASAAPGMLGEVCISFAIYQSGHSLWKDPGLGPEIDLSMFFLRMRIGANMADPALILGVGIGM